MPAVLTAMPAVNSAPFQATPVTNTGAEETPVAPDFTVSLSGSVPEMFRRTMTAMIDGQRVSPLIPLPCGPQLISCWSKPELGAHIDASKTEEEEGELLEADEAEEEVSTSSSSDANAWALKPSVGTWLLPLPEKPEVDDDAALKIEKENQIVDVSDNAKLQEVTVSKVQGKGLSARVKTWFCCVQALAAEPKPAKTQKASAAERKPAKTPKAAKTQKAKG